MGYAIRRGEALLVSGLTEHTAVNQVGRVRRIPRDDDRERLAAHALRSDSARPAR